MGRIIGPDKLGSLTEAGGNITLGPSIVTLGGQQYRTTQSLNKAVPAASLNSLRFVYLVLNAGVPELNISSQPNSVGPGTTSWKLIGAYYSNGIDGSFGSFVSIEGAPTTSVVDAGLTIIRGSTTDPIKSGNTSVDRVVWSRHGRYAYINWTYTIVTLSGGTAGSGSYQWEMPQNLVGLHGNGLELGSSTAGGLADNMVGHGAGHRGGLDQANGDVLLNPNGTQVYWYAKVGATRTHQSSGFMPVGTTNSEFALRARIPIQGWDNTPLKEL